MVIEQNVTISPFFHTERCKSCGALIDVIQQLSVGDLIFKITDRNIVAMRVVDFEQVFVYGFLRENGLLGLLGEELQPGLLLGRRQLLCHK